MNTWIDPGDLLLMRLDSEFYSPEFVAHERAVVCRKQDGDLLIRSLGDLGKLVTGPFGSMLPSSLFRSQGIPLFRVQNVYPFFPVEANLVFLDPSTSSELSSSEMKSGTILISKAGRVGDACIVPCNFPLVNITEHVIGLRPSDEIDPYFLVAALNEQFVNTQLRRFGVGTILQYLGVVASRSVQVPVPPMRVQLAIGNKLRKAEQLRSASNAARRKTAELLAKYLPPLPEVSTGNTSWTNNLDLSSRLDATFYRLSFLELERSLRGRFGSLTSLDRWVAKARNGHDFREFVGDGTPYLRVGDIDPYECDPTAAARVSVRREDLPASERIQVGDVLLTRKGRFGTALVVDTVVEESLISSEVIRLQLRSGCDPYVLAAFLNSPHGQMQMERGASGTTMLGLTREALSAVLVPTFKPDLVASIRKSEIAAIAGWRASRQLLVSANSDVAALISGTLDEQALVVGETTTIEDFTFQSLIRNGVQS